MVKSYVNCQFYGGGTAESNFVSDTQSTLKVLKLVKIGR